MSLSASHICRSERCISDRVAFGATRAAVRYSLRLQVARSLALVKELVFITTVVTLDAQFFGAPTFELSLAARTCSYICMHERIRSQGKSMAHDRRDHRR